MLRSAFFSLCIIVIVNCVSFNNLLHAQTATPTPTPTTTATPVITPIGTGSIFGTVTDKSGNPISGATVSLKCKMMNYKDSTITGINGDYEFLDLSAGNYTVTVKKSGYKKEKERIALAEGENRQVDFQLKTRKGNDNDNDNDNGNNNHNDNNNGNGNMNDNSNHNDNDNSNMNNNSNGNYNAE